MDFGFFFFTSGAGAEEGEVRVGGADREIIMPFLRTSIVGQLEALARDKMSQINVGALAINASIMIL